ncbi:hypothetical protein BGX34_001879 [Mortierella sp. NVP85]|nr:hypothetical protein BGX34_001879 [Mortierella sp. NVP85]
MAALDDKVLDPMTHRPRKVVVCKDHVPLPRHSLTADALALQHAANAPKPSVPGLFRTVVGERVADIKEGEPVIGYHYNKPESSRSLNQGSYAGIMKGLRASRYHGKGKDDEKEDNSTPTSTSNRAHSGSTLPKYRQGRFTVSTIASDPETKESQDSRDDDRDWEDNKQERITMKEMNMGGEASEKSLENLAFSSKLMEHKNHETQDVLNENGQSKAVGDDEWDAASTNALDRREVIAGM